MSQFVTERTKTFKTAADYSTKLFYIVYLSAEGVVTLASAATQQLMGVISTKPAAATSANVEVTLKNSQGTAKVVAGGTIHIGDILTADSAGKAVATTTVGQYIIGESITEGSAGDIVEFIPRGGRYAATS